MQLPNDTPSEHRWVHLTEGEPPIRFVARARPEDFEVEELALYEPSGEGEHLFLLVEKRDLTTREAMRRIARELGADLRGCGVAGRKDRRAVTLQWISVHGATPEAGRALELEGVRVLRAELHSNRLRTGHLRGNRFRLRLRELAEGDRPRLARVLATIERRGLPNYFGAQRFGNSGRNDELGRLLVQKRHRELVLALASPAFATDTPLHAELRDAIEHEERSALRRLGQETRALGRDLAGLARQLARRPGDWRSAVRALDRELTSVMLGALQARVFNRVLAQRVAARDAPAFDELAPGDLAWLADRGAVFAVEDPAAEAARLAAFELGPSGPIAGHRMTRASGLPGELEAAALAAEGVALEDFRGLGMGLDQRGARRPLRVRLEELELAFDGDSALLGFTLRKGSYATALLAELAKSGYGAAPGEPEAAPGEPDGEGD